MISTDYIYRWALCTMIVCLVVVVAGTLLFGDERWSGTLVVASHVQTAAIGWLFGYALHVDKRARRMHRANVQAPARERFPLVRRTSERADRERLH